MVLDPSSPPLHPSSQSCVHFMCYVTHSYVRGDLFICVTWVVYMCDVSHSHVWLTHTSKIVAGLLTCAHLNIFGQTLENIHIYIYICIRWHILKYARQCVRLLTYIEINASTYKSVEMYGHRLYSYVHSSDSHLHFHECIWETLMHECACEHSCTESHERTWDMTHKSTWDVSS